MASTVQRGSHGIWHWARVMVKRLSDQDGIGIEVRLVGKTADGFPVFVKLSPDDALQLCADLATELKSPAK